MGTRLAAVDAVLAQARPFAQPILTELRERMHAACPGVEEAVKWRNPAFLVEGRLVAGMAAFTRHCAFGLWREREVRRAHPDLAPVLDALGRVASIEALPGKAAFRRVVRAALALPDAKAAARPRVVVRVPAALRAALAAAPAAQRTFAALAPSHRREYCEWIAAAKRPATLQRRLQQAIAWLREGKRRNWRYEAR